jgi:hypothetical protein
MPLHIGLYSDWMTRVRSPAGAKDFSSSLCIQTALGPTTQLPIQWVWGVKHGQGVTLTTHPHLAPRSRMSRSYTSPPPKHHSGMYWGQVYFTTAYPYSEKLFLLCFSFQSLSNVLVSELIASC